MFACDKSTGLEPTDLCLSAVGLTLKIRSIKDAWALKRAPERARILNASHAYPVFGLRAFGATERIVSDQEKQSTTASKSLMAGPRTILGARVRLILAELSVYRHTRHVYRRCLQKLEAGASSSIDRHVR